LAEPDNNNGQKKKKKKKDKKTKKKDMIPSNGKYITLVWWFQTRYPPQQNWLYLMTEQ
jgi:hypothetical protein